MKRKSFILVGLFALLVGINMQVKALNPSQDMVVRNDVKVKEPSLDEWMPDKNLQQSLVKTMELNNVSELTQESLSNYEGSLTLFSSNIMNLKGLEYATSTSFILIENNLISDLSPLANLRQLTNLVIEGNAEISDIRPLTNLTNLQNLWISDKKIEDISPLAGMKWLQALRIENNQISDLKPLSGLISLTYIVANNNKIIDLKPIAGLQKLSSLQASDNQISDLKPISNLRKLRDLILNRNAISSLAPLKGLRNSFANLRVEDQLIVNEEITGYVGSKIVQKNNTRNLNDQISVLIPEGSDGVYYADTDAITWTYKDSGKREAISTFDATGAFSFTGKIIQPIIVKDDLSSIEVKNSTIYVGDKWEAKDNFVKAIDKDGKAIEFKDVSVEGKVDTSKAVSSKVKYTILDHAGKKVSKEATINVKTKDNGSSGNNNDTKGDNDKLPHTGYDISVVGFLIGIASILGVGSLYLNRKQ